MKNKIEFLIIKFILIINIILNPNFLLIIILLKLYLKMDKFTINPWKKFHEEWALVTAGKKDNFNTMTISWGGMGTLFSRPVVTVYIKPARYTHDFVLENDIFTVSFYDEKHRESLTYLGNHSGKDEDKVAKVGFSPKFLENGGITFEQAKTTIVLKKLFTQQLDRNNIPKDIIKTYFSNDHERPSHTMFIGEVIDFIEN
jgi:flavin reductase (DIM6/NTAB) family NADH-FMN oxidoreductase RutF